MGTLAFVLAPLVALAMILQTRAAWLDIAALPSGALDAMVLAAAKAFIVDLLPGVHGVRAQSERRLPRLG